jgi:predicted transcriptional regulator
MRRKRGLLEREVLDAVDAAGTPQTVSQVAAMLSGDPAYTTVMSTLARLHDKGALTRTREGRGFAYSMAAAPQSVPAALAARQMHRLLEAEGRRDDVLARFVAELSPDDERMLIELLDTHGSSRSAGTDWKEG